MPYHPKIIKFCIHYSSMFILCLANVMIRKILCYYKTECTPYSAWVLYFGNENIFCILRSKIRRKIIVIYVNVKDSLRHEACHFETLWLWIRLELQYGEIFLHLVDLAFFFLSEWILWLWNLHFAWDVWESVKTCLEKLYHHLSFSINLMFQTLTEESL